MPAATRSIPYCLTAGQMQSWSDGNPLAPVMPLSGPNELGFLAGPFVTGGGEWVVLQDLFGSHEPSLIPSGDHCFTSYTGDAVDASGAAIPYPPLHMHHIHLARVAPQGTDPPGGYCALQQHWMETHGDYRLHPAGIPGLPDGYSISPPNGTCRPLGHGAQLRIYAEVNDVRPANESSPVQWWLRIRLGLAPPSHQAVGKLVLWFPFDDFSIGRIACYNAGADERLTWWTMRVPSRLRLVGQPWLHTHRSRYAGLLVLRNGPSDPWLLAPELKDTLACARGGWCSTATRLRSYLELKARKLPACEGRSVLFCRDEPHAPSSVMAPTSGGAMLRVARQGRLVCRGGDEGTLEEGDTLTVLAFSRPLYDVDTDPFPMHTLVFSHAELLAGANATSADVSIAVYMHPLPDSNDEYGVWHLATGQVNWPGLRPPPVSSC